MYKVYHVDPSYTAEGGHFVEIGIEHDLDAAYEVIRSHLMESNSALMLNEDAPAACREAAERNVNRNKHLEFDKLITGTVIVDGEYPEWESYHIEENKFQECVRENSNVSA
jgi:hypothetical protein